MGLQRGRASKRQERLIGVGEIWTWGSPASPVYSLREEGGPGLGKLPTSTHFSLLSHPSLDLQMTSPHPLHSRKVKAPK